MANVLEKFDALFKDAEDLTIPQLESFVHEVLKFFETLRTTLISGTNEEKKEALEIATKLQKKLEDLSQKAYQKSGMNPDQISSFLSNSQNFSPEEWKTFTNVENEIGEYDKDLKNQIKPPQPAKKKGPSASKEPWRKI
jgi:hypothetical protein